MISETQMDELADKLSGQDLELGIKAATITIETATRQCHSQIDTLQRFIAILQHRENETLHQENEALRKKVKQLEEKLSVASRTHVHGKATLCRVHGRVTPQLLFQCVLAPCAFTTEELCEKIYRTKHVERKHRIAVMRAATNLAKRRDTKARAAVDGVAEIDRATSYFVGLLGERYGAVPKADAYTAGRLERQPWLEEHRGGKSLTELEILHGVLNNSTRMAGRAHFYFRSREYARKKGGEYPSPDSRECREAGRSQEPDPQERLSDR